VTTVDLQSLNNEVGIGTLEAVQWLLFNHGPISEGKWDMKELRYVTFKNGIDATYFILKWS